MARRPSPRTFGNIAVIVLLGGLLVTQAMQAMADHQPADKVVASGSTTKVMRSFPVDAEDFATDTVKLMEVDLRTSSPADLLIEVTAECGIYTKTATVGNDESTATATVDMWLTIDGVAVPVAGTEDNGKVTFCNRAQTHKFTDLDDTNAVLEISQETMAANGFNWVGFNTGNGIHTVALWAHLDPVTGTDAADAEAAATVGKRVMVIQSVKFPHHVDEVEDQEPSSPIDL